MAIDRILEDTLMKLKRTTGGLVKIVLAPTFEPYLNRLSAALPGYELRTSPTAGITPPEALAAVKALESEVGPLRPELLAKVLLVDHAKKTYREFICFPRAWDSYVQHAIDTVQEEACDFSPRVQQFRLTARTVPDAMHALALWSPGIGDLERKATDITIPGISFRVENYFMAVRQSVFPFFRHAPLIYHTAWRNGGIRFLLPEWGFAVIEPETNGKFNLTVQMATPMEASSVLRARALLTGWVVVQEPTIAFSPWEQRVITASLREDLTYARSREEQVRKLTRMLPHGELGLQEAWDHYGLVVTEKHDSVAPEIKRTLRERAERAVKSARDVGWKSVATKVLDRWRTH